MIDKAKPDFGLSGKLSEEQRTTSNGVVLKFTEPVDAKRPNKNWKLFPFKGKEPLGMDFIGI
jgi:smad nuclear-interacting protein 1